MLDPRRTIGDKAGRRIGAGVWPLDGAASRGLSIPLERREPVRTAAAARPPSGGPAVPFAGRWMPHLARAAAACALLATIAVVVWGADRGLDVTDEGYYLLEYQRPTASTTSFAVIVHALLGSDRAPVVSLRFARLAITLTTAALFAAGAWSWMRATPAVRRDRADSAAVALAALAGALVSYSHLPQTLSYNSLGNALLLSWGAALLAALAPLARGATPRAFLAACGAAAALAFFVKPPAGLALLATSHAAILAAREAPRLRTSRAPLAWLWIGTGLGAATFFVAFSSPGEWIDGIRAAAPALVSTSYGPRALAAIYLRDAAHTAGTLLLSYWPALLATGIAAALRRRHAATILAPASAVVALIACTAWQVVADAGSGLRDPGVTPYLAALVCLGIWTVAAPGGDEAPDETPATIRSRRAGFALLAVAPLAAAAGSNNGLSFQVLEHAAPWFVLLVALAATASAGRALVATTLLAACCLCASQVWRGLVVAPYRLRTDLRAQSESVEGVPGLRGLLVDRDSAEFLKRVRTALETTCGFRDGDPIVALHDMAGVVYAVGGTSPGTSYFPGARVEANTSLLKRAPEAEKLSAILLLDARRPEDAPAELRGAGLPFPEGYEAVARIDSPYLRQVVTVWRPLAPRRR